MNTARFPQATDVALGAAALGASYLLKDFYSTATADDLGWILRPTAALVSLVSGVEFAEEARAGFLSRERLFLIAPACAGVNFLIAAFCTAVFGLVGRFRGPGAKATVFVVGALAAYLAAIVANATRILIAMRLHALPSFPLREELHRIEGVAVYFVALCLLFLGARALVAHREGGRRGLPPA